MKLENRMYKDMNEYLRYKTGEELIETLLIIREATEVGMTRELAEELHKFDKYDLLFTPMEVLRWKYNEMIEDKL